MKPALRTPLLKFHLWTGIVVGCVFVVVALSGAVLSFRKQFERKLDPERFIVAASEASLPLNELVARAQADHPQAAFLSLRSYADPTMPFLALFSDKVYVHLNPHTGAFLGARRRYGEGFGWVEGLHKYLLLDPGLGENLNGAFDLVFAFLVLMGIALWWPATRRALAAGLTLNPKLSGRPWNLNVHKVFGIYASAVLLFSITSGIPISFESTRSIIDALTFSQRDVPPAAPAGAPAMFGGFDAVKKRIETLMPGATDVYIPLPQNGLIAAYAIASDAPHLNARSYVYLDPSANLVRYEPYAGTSLGYRAYYWMLSLHTGMTGGLPVQIALLFGTLSVPILAWSGIASYLRRKSRKRLREQAPARLSTTASAQ